MYGMSFGADVKNNPDYTTTRERLQFNMNPPYDPQYNILQTATPVPITVDLTQVSTNQQQITAPIHHGLGYVPKVVIAYTLPLGVTPFNSNVQGYSNGIFLLTESAEVIEYVTYTVNTELLTINDYVISNGVAFSGTYTSICPALQIKYIICNNPGFILQPSLT